MIDKLTIAVTSMDAMAKFYRAVLGVELAPVELAGHELQTGVWDGIELMLCPKALAGVDADINTIQIRFLVDDVPGAYDAGLRAGGAVVSEPVQDEGRLHAALRDPDGNSLELRQNSPS